MAQVNDDQDSPPTSLDLAIIGAGIYGIQAARTYLQLHPLHQIIIFEADESIGGVWSSKRVYNAFWTQTPIRILEFSDMPLVDIPDSDKHFGFFPAKYVSEYLEQYVATRIYNGTPLATRIHLNSKIKTLTKSNDHWILDIECQRGESSESLRYYARKVIDATGLTSTANIPSIPGLQSFKGIMIHHKDFGINQQSLLSKHGPRSIVVIGGAKSAADVAYASAIAGKDVTWVIRRSGAGPAAFVSAKGRGMYKNSNESFYTRLVSHFLVSYFMDESKTWLGRFLHWSAFGRKLLQMAWRGINQKTHSLADYDRPDGKSNGFYNLRPDTEIFWQNDSTGICLHEDFYDIIAKRVKIYREDVKCFSDAGVELKGGTKVDADAVVFATGWKTSHPKIQNESGNTSLNINLGLSDDGDLHELSIPIEWSKLENDYRSQILKRFPILLNAPKHHQQPVSCATPLRLYKGMLPTNDRSIAFLGQMMLGNHFRSAEVQALYAIAALDGVLSLPSEEEMKAEIAKTLAWCRLRYLGKGSAGNWIYWDLIPYTDNLLAELGLSSHLHSNFWKNLFSPCFASDLKNLIYEYTSKYNIGTEGMNENSQS